MLMVSTAHRSAELAAGMMVDAMSTHAGKSLWKGATDHAVYTPGIRFSAILASQECIIGQMYTQQDLSRGCRTQLCLIGVAGCSSR